MIGLLVLAALGGGTAALMAMWTQLSSLRLRLEQLERERATDREMLEAVLLEEPGKLRRLMGHSERG